MIMFQHYPKKVVVTTFFMLRDANGSINFFSIFSLTTILGFGYLVSSFIEKKF